MKDEVLNSAESDSVTWHSDAGASPLIVRRAIEVFHLITAVLLAQCFTHL